MDARFSKPLINLVTALLAGTANSEESKQISDSPLKRPASLDFLS